MAKMNGSAKTESAPVAPTMPQNQVEDMSVQGSRMPSTAKEEIKQEHGELGMQSDQMCLPMQLDFLTNFTAKVQHLLASVSESER